MCRVDNLRSGSPVAFAALAKERSEGEGKGVALEPEGKPLEMESAGEVAPELEKSSEEFEGETFVLSASIDSSSNEASALTGLLDENFRSMSLEVDSENGPKIPLGSEEGDLTQPKISGATRTVVVYNIPPSIGDVDLCDWAEKYGSLRAIDTSGRVVGGWVSLTFYDLRHAVLAAEGFAGQGENPTPVSFNVAYASVPHNVSDGIILHDSLSLSGKSLIEWKELLLKVLAFGDINYLTAVEKFPHWESCLVEYFDIRDSQKALENLSASRVLGEMASVAPILSSMGQNQAAMYPQYLQPCAFGGAPNEYWMGQEMYMNANNVYGANPENTYSSGKLTYVFLQQPAAQSPMKESGGKFRRTDSRRNKSDPIFAFDVEEAKEGGEKARTTIMIKNIPNKYNQEMLLNVLEANYVGQYDFFYLPIDFKNKCNLGYAFVNFVESKGALRFYQEFHRQKWSDFNSKKVCEITYARVQGKKALAEHFKNSKFPCQNPAFLPVILDK